MSTYNPALIDALPDAALGDVVFCYRDNESGESVLSRFSDIYDYEGTSFGDLSIIEEYKKCITKFSMTDVFIGSLEPLSKLFDF